jgi:glycerophosphoryl diester phosphodiesterase
VGTLQPSGPPHIFAHRGGTRWAPENTLAAFSKAIKAGCYGIELDVQRCKSGEIIVLHDPTLNRTTDGTGLLKDKTFEEVRGLSAGKWFSAEFAAEKLPTLDEVLNLVDGKLVVNVEIKNTPIGYPNIENDILRILKPYKYPDKIVISSLDHELLFRLHEMNCPYQLALLSDCILVDVKNYAAKVGAHAWNPRFWTFRKDNLDSTHQAGLEVNIWTVNGPDNWREVIAMGVDGIITDDPLGLMALVKSSS